MKQRIIGRTGDKVGILGFGAAGIHNASEKEARETLELAFASGINYYDCAGSEKRFMEYYGAAHDGVRNQVMYQVHFGADYSGDEYGWSPEPDSIKRNVEADLKRLRTDYIDYGFIHCLDKQEEVDEYLSNGAYDYLMEMQAAGVVKHLGLSTHTPAIANRLMDMGIPDVIMFSVNAAYDACHGEYAFGETGERELLYRRCLKEGVGISVMKPYSGGQLLDAKQSPFGFALTPAQCLRYILDKPGIVTVLPGYSGLADLKATLAAIDAPEEECDYSILAGCKEAAFTGRCVYCGHCHPCPAGLDIALINKYYDLSRVGDDMARDHYMKLDAHASDCLKCGHCDDKCPFSVRQSGRMEEIAGWFGR